MPSLLAMKTDEHNALVEERAGLMAQAETAGSFDGLRERIDEIDTQLPGIAADIQRAKTERDRITSEPAAHAEEGPLAPLGGFKRLRGSIGQQFLGSTDWQRYLEERAPGGNFGMSTKVESPKIALDGSVVPSLLGRRQPTGALVTGASATGAGAFIVEDDSGIWDEGPTMRELTVLDLITRGTTDSDTVGYVRTTSFTNNADTVAEATSIDPASDVGRKPQSALAFARVTSAVKIIAHGVPATKNALADAGQMRTILDNFLRYGILEELEDQIVNGAGVGEDFNGILDVGTGTQAFDTSILKTLRSAKTKVRTGGKARANGILINPEDWEELDYALTTGGGGSNYRQARDDSFPRVWGLPVVESEAIAAGTAVVADFTKAVLWDRQATTIEATQGYLDFFMKNLVMILAEMRAGFGILRPSAFVVADLSS